MRLERKQGMVVEWVPCLELEKETSQFPPTITARKSKRGLSQGREDCFNASELIHIIDNRMQHCYMKNREGRHKEFEIKNS